MSVSKYSATQAQQQMRLSHEICRPARKLVLNDESFDIIVYSCNGPLYLSLVTDAYSRKIVGYHVHESLHAESLAQAFKQALRERRRCQQLVHHSDRGIQYCSALYHSLHQRHDVQCSMTDGYNCYQNALAEQINGILKMELLPSSPEDFEQARQMVDEAVQIHNTERPHMALRNKAPDAVHRAF